MKIAITGATGFLGSHLLKKIISNYTSVLAIVRNSNQINDQVETFIVPVISADTQYLDAFEGVDCIVHCAARVHMMQDDSESPIEAFREVNTRGTINLARQAIKSGVRRFIFISSIKVNGEETNDKPFTADDTSLPSDPYGISKHEAEVKLLELADETGLEVVIIRPPLVYGPGVKANFLSLIKLVAKRYPIPLGAVNKNSRSIVGIDNLIEFIITCIEHPAAKNQKFLVSDGKSLSTSKLIQAIGNSMSKNVILVPVPKWLFFMAGSLLSKQDVIQRLFSSLEVDISKNKELLGWVPPYSTEDILKKTTNYYLTKSSKESSC